MRCYVFLFIVITFGISNARLVRKQPVSPPKESSIKYYTKQNDIIIPIKIHLDRALTNTLSQKKKQILREKFNILAKDILKDVENIFLRPNLAQKIKFELVNVRMIKNNTKKIVMSENASEYLRSYCLWQGEMKKKHQTWFFSVLFTGLDLYYLNKEGKIMRESTGRGYRKGVCSNGHSCALLEWHPENIAYILAHEIAHSLGVTHDGPPHNECKSRGHIMDSKYSPRNPAKTWSSCNRRALSQFLKGEQAWCLRRDPTEILI